MQQHTGTLGRGVILAGGLVLLGAAHSAAQNKAQPAQPPPPPPKTQQPPPAQTPQKTNPAVPGNQNKGTPPNPATPATPSDKASNKALQTPSRTGETPSRQSSGPLPQKAQTMLNDLGTLNLQNFLARTPNITNATDLLNENQVQDLLASLSGNPQAQQNAQRLTEQLRASGLLRPDQQIVGFMDGRLVVATVAANATAAALPQQAQNMLNGLTGLNLQNFNVERQQVVNATDQLNQNQINDLAQALNSNPQAQQMARRLTDMLRATGRLQPNQQVVGFADGRLFVANVTATAAANVQLPQQAQNMFNGLTGLNLQNFNVERQQVINATDQLNQNQINDLMQAIQSNPQAQQMAQRLTDMLRATGRLQPNQQVVGFADGRIFVGARVPPIPDLVTGLAGLNLQGFNAQGIVTATDLLNENQVRDLLAALNNHPQARQIATRLTDQLLSGNRINPDQMVVGFMDGRVLVALTAQQFQVLINGLINADLQNVNQLNVINIVDVIREKETQNLIQTLDRDAQARQNAVRLTQQLQSSNRIRRDQRVVGFLNGSVVIAALPEK
jgi:hypothetical protein